MKLLGNLLVCWCKLLMSLAVISTLFIQKTTASSVYDGYTLFAPFKTTTTYLIDIDGNVYKTWESDYKVGLSAYILDDQSLLRTTDQSNSVFGDTGGAGGGVEKYDWDGNLTWSYTYSSDTYCSHHDVEYLPNGNLLMVAWELKTEDEAIAAGRDSSLISEGALWPCHIIEVQPDGTSGGTIVWEWHAWDHLVQEYDSSKDNYGTVADHPELINLNYDGNSGQADWLHINGIDYNEEYDQIVLSVRNFSEIWIIDHSTTTAEAASHSGGTYGKGGDLLYRWGNPQTYDAGTSDDQKLYSQHNASWIPDDYPGAGDILIFNNGKNRPGDSEYSSVEQITTPINSDGSYSLTSGSAYSPESTTWTYDCSFYASAISGVQRLPNGNTLICDGPDGDFHEIDSDGNTLWTYTNPYPARTSGAPVFRCYRYSSEYLGIYDDPVTLTLAVDGSGTTTPDVGESTVESGVDQSITATPADGYKFISWTATANATVADCSSASTTVTLAGDATVTATFVSEDVASSELTITTFKVAMDTSKENDDSVKIFMDMSDGFTFDNTSNDLKLQVSGWNFEIPAGSEWTTSKNQSFNSTLDVGDVKVIINENKAIIKVIVSNTSLSGLISTANGVVVLLTVGDNIYTANVAPDDKSTWNINSSSNVEGFTANVDSFTGTYIYKDEGDKARYKFVLTGTGLTDPTTDGYSDDFTPKVYLSNAEWDFSDIEPTVKNKKYIYSLKEGTSTLYLLLNFKSGKWRFRAIDKSSDLGASVSKDDTVSFSLNLTSDSESYTSVNEIETDLKTILK